MSNCGNEGAEINGSDPCSVPRPTCCSAASGYSAGGKSEAFAWFDAMIGRCLDRVTDAKAGGEPIVGIMCEFTPRELIMAAGGVPVCLCGGAEATIAAAEAELPAALCPLIKSTYGYHVQKSNPFLEMADLIVAETTCDGKKKMYELLAQSRPLHIVELPQKPDDPGAFDHWLGELRKLKATLEVRFHTRITDQKLRQAISTMNRERALERQLAALMAAANPPMTGRQLLGLKSSISGIPCDLKHYEQAIIDLTGAEPDTDLSTRVRVMLTGVPTVHGAERVVDMIEDRGGLIVCMENCTGLKPLLEDVDVDDPDPLRAVATKYFHLPCSVMTPNDRRLDVLRQLADEYKPQCVVELIWQGCLTYDVEAALVRRFVEEELGLAYLRIVTDYSPSDSARIAVRIEAMFETVGGQA